MYYEPLLPCRYYHIFNHAVGDENLFRNHDNYLFFLKQYAVFIRPVVKTFAYCLMPNHFHFLIQIEEEEVIEARYRLLKKQPEPMPIDVEYPLFVMQQFSNFFNSYAKAYNKRFNRKGALFIDKIRRKEVNSNKYFTSLVAYIHNNPVHHAFCGTADLWAYSSLASIASQRPTHLERDYVLDWFGGIESYVSFHKQINSVPKDQNWEFGY